MKTLKYNSKIKIALFFLMFFLIIVFFNNESNATAYSSVSRVLSSGYAEDGLKVGDTVTGGTMSAVFGNNAVYCIETGNQYVESNYTYTLKQIIEVNSTTNSKYQPLLYIFENYPKSAFESSSSTMAYFNNASQIAIWGTIKMKSNFSNSYFDAKDNITVNSGISGYDAISTYLYTGGYSSYNVARPYFAVYHKDSSNHKFYYGVASYQTKYSSALKVVGTEDSYKRASHLAYLIYQKATETTAQKYEGKIYVFHSNNSQNFIIFSKPDEIIITPTINLNLYKKDTSNTKVKGAKVEISSNSNVKTINGVKSAITVESSETSGKFNNSAIKIVPSTNNGIVKINLTEKIAPSGYLIKENTVVLTIEYNTTTGTITKISTDKGSTYYIDYESSTEINFVNAKFPEWYIYKKDQNSNSVKDISFDTKIEISEGNVYTGKYTSGEDGKTGNIICENAQKEMAKKYMSTNKNVTAKVTIEEQQKEGYGTPVTCTFILTYDGKTVSASDLNNAEDCTLNSSSITIENTKIEPIWLTVKKVDNENMGIGSATFEVIFTQDESSTKNTLNIPKSGGKYYETTAYSPKSFNPICVTIKETKGPEHYNKANEDVELKFVWEGTEKEGKWVPEITSGKKQLVAFTDAETTPSATYKYYPSDTERLIRTDKTSDRDFNRSFGIKIKNTPRIVTDLVINKKDKSNISAIAGATFRLYFNNVTYVKVRGKTYVVKDIIDENKVIERNGKKYYIKIADGLTLLVPTSEITSDYDNRLYIEGLKTNSIGQIKIEEIEAIANRDTVYIAVTELESISGFDKLQDTAKLLLRYNNYGSDKWELFIRSEDAGLERFDELDKGNVNTLSEEYYSIDSGKLNLTLKDDYQIDEFSISKTDALNSDISVGNAIFDITLKNIKSVKNHSGGTKLIGVKGSEILEDLVVDNPDEPVVITIEETEAPEGYKKIEGTITITLKREGTTYYIYEVKKDSTVLDWEFETAWPKYENNVLYANIKDIPALETLDLIKKDSQDTSKTLEDAEFELEFENVAYYYINETKHTEETTIQKVKISDGITNILPKDITQPMKVILKETKSPVGYKRIEGTITLEIQYKNNTDGYSIKATKADEVLDVEFFTNEGTDKELDAEVPTGAEIENKKIAKVTMYDIPIINLGGIVWEDTQSYHKDIKGPDGLLNNEEKGIPGIGVEVYTSKGEKVTKDIYGEPLKVETAADGDTIEYILNNEEKGTITLNAGEYIFPNLEKGEYYIKFFYDGINYQTVECSTNTYKLTSPKESKVEEQDRTKFNNKFKTIAKDEAIHQNESEKIKLEYEYSNTNETSKLKTTIKGENPKNGNNPDFQMTAISKNYLKAGDSNWGEVWNDDGTINREHYALDINCGLTEKFFDLALGTDVKSAKVKINGKETEYNYAQIMDGALEDLTLDGRTQNNSSEQGTEYTLYLYKSDYNFRIEDYKTYDDGGIKNNVNDEDDDKVNYDTLEELEVYVTYSIILKNQSKQYGRVETFDYYYDSNYSLVDSSDYTLVKNKETKTYETVKIKEENKQGKYKAVNNEDEHKIEFTNIGDTNLEEKNNYYREEIEVTFKVKKTDDEDRKLEVDKTFSNVGEITSYSTPSGGFVDYDSAPGNGIEEGKIIQYEDDTDEALGINISVKEELIRTISGNVFEDVDKNGKNEREKAIEDVIVQLIEIKTIKGYNYEYIWQETRSGNNQVKRTQRNGYATYKNSVTEGSGNFEFKDFIPGNYIIRYIYGDGKTYDITTDEYKASADNVKKYNGQDYKSTIDSHYGAIWYNTAGYNTGESVARDNEARRLEVMANSTTINRRTRNSNRSIYKQYRI